MIVHTRQMSTNVAEIPETLDFHIALTYPAHAKSALSRVFGTIPEASGLMVAAYDVFQNVDGIASSDYLRQAISTASTVLASEQIEFVIGEWRCLMIAVLFLRDCSQMYLEHMSSVFCEIAKSVEEVSNVSVSGASSNLISDFRRLPDAAVEAAEAIQYGRYVDSAPAMIALSDRAPAGSRVLSDRILQQASDFTALVERLIHAIRCENAKALQEFGGQCVSALTGGIARSSALQFRFISFCGQLERSLLQSGIVDPRFFTEHHLILQMLMAENESALLRVVEEHVQQIRIYFNMKKHARFADSMQAVMDYIDENLTDPSLSVSSIADSLSINASTLATHFKRFYGDSIPNTIHKKRIAKIRSALLSSNAPIRQIASAYGYISIATFNRTFFKYEGMYPRAFRQQHASQ